MASLTPYSGADYYYHTFLFVTSNGVGISGLPSHLKVAESYSEVTVDRSGLLYRNDPNFAPINLGVINGYRVSFSVTIGGTQCTVSGTCGFSASIGCLSPISGTSVVFGTSPSSDDWASYGWVVGVGHFNNVVVGTSFSTGDLVNTLRSGSWTTVDSYVILPILIRNYLIEFDANGGTGAPGSIRAKHGESWTCPSTTPTRDGYTFVGWATSPSAIVATYLPGNSYTSSGNLSLYAVWEGNELVCVFDPNGGLVSGNYFALVRIGGTFPALPTPSYSGHTFQGWYTALTGGTLVQQGDAVTQSADFTLYAHWQGPTLSHTVYFNALGGTVSPTSMTIQEGTALGALPTPTRTGYGFVGWYDPSGAAITASTVMGTDDIYAIARWSATSITITFDANGGTVDEASRAVAYGMQISTLPIPTRTDWKFDGWYTAATGGTQVFSTTIATANATIYAHWRAPEAVDWWGVTFG